MKSNKPGKLRRARRLAVKATRIPPVRVSRSVYRQLVASGFSDPRLRPYRQHLEVR